MMPILTINRANEYENKGRKIQILINDKSVAKIKNGEMLKLELPSGKHMIQAKIDWCYSNILELELNKDTNIKLGKGKGSALYRITFGYKNYLQLTQLNK